MKWLLSKTGTEQAFGALFVWLSETHPVHGEPFKLIAGGAWVFGGDSGPGFLIYNLASYSNGVVGVRACGDHLELE